MLQLISKIQHNTYEKGEFSDEQLRDLDETIRIVKDFPWDAERALTDIQLTGPSVTIQDNELNFLKIALYFNGKFSIYYLDKHNHLYEYHAPAIDEACNLVIAFFDQALNLKSFEKHFFNIGNKPHFITNNFMYKAEIVMRPNIVIGACFLLLLLTLILLFAFHMLELTNMVLVVMVISSMFMAVFLTGYVAEAASGKFIQISRGNDLFTYSSNGKQILTFKKSDIRQINHRIKSKRQIESVIIIFNNGYTIDPGPIISPSVLLGKFPEKLNIPVYNINLTIIGERIVKA